MTPAEAKAWIKELLPARDNVLWVVFLWSGLAGIAAAQFPQQIRDIGLESWLPYMEKAGGLSALIGAKMGWSWASTPTTTTGPRLSKPPEAELNKCPDCGVLFKLPAAPGCPRPGDHVKASPAQVPPSVADTEAVP